MDIRDRVMGDQPQDFLHKIASIIPGYTGYVDKERRREADKLLRTELARRYSAQRDRLNRVQQNLARSHQLEQIGEVDRITGVFQRFIDRLNTATYGYAGLFGPVKVDATDLDQIYAFDMALASGVDTVSSAIDAVESAASGGTGTGTPELPAALGRLSSVVDDLNTRLNQRAEYLTSGRRLPEPEYKAMVANATQPPTAQAYQAPQQGYQSYQGQGYQGQGYQGQGYQGQGYQGQGYQPQQDYQGYQPGSSYNQPPQSYQAGSSYNQPGGSSMAGSSDLGAGGYSQPGGATDVGSGDTATGMGVPTTNLNMQTQMPNEPGMGSMVNEGQTPEGDMQSPQGLQAANPTSGAPEAANMGIETASSPSHSTDPGSPGSDLSQGLSLSDSLGTPDTGGTPGTGDIPGNPNIDAAANRPTGNPNQS